MTARTTFAQKLAEKLAPAPLTEGVESIQEVSDSTLTRYSKAARDQITAIKKRPGPVSKANKPVIAKREAGIEKAGAIKSERHAKAWDAHSKASHAAFKAAADDTLSKHGYTVAHAGPNSNVYTKHDPETNSLFVAKHHFGTPSTRDSHHSHEGAIKLVSSNGTVSDIRHSSWSHRPSRHLDGDKPVDLHAEHSKTIHDELERHHRWSKDSSFNQHMNESVTFPTDEEIFEAVDHLVQAELIAEGKTPYGGYVSPVRKKWIEDQRAKQGKPTLKEEEATPEELAAAEAADHEALENAEEVPEVVAEGRGRPRKDGTSAVGADREHIVMQLRKHVSLRGQNDIEFKDGKKVKVGEGQARLALIMHNGLRGPIEKGHFMDRLDASHESFKDAVRSKTPEEAGKAPEAKSRITLPAMDRLKAKMAAEN